MGGKPVLTISLLCSGRPETKKCLDSLKMLRERIPSELLLVDTGCGEEMKQLLWAYADEVIPFAWCDDFSKARNAGLEKACGEWFLYLDDDEWFIDTKAIEDFFISGKYENYGYAVYVQRNFFDQEGSIYTDDLVARMYSLRRRGRFQGVVHEYFEPLMEPAKVLPSVVKHFGYVYKNQEDKKKHAMRNISLLEKAITEKNGDIADIIRLRAHLAHEYFLMEDYTKLLEFCKETLQKFESQNDTDCNRHRGCFYCGEIFAEMLLEEWEAAFHAYERAAHDKRNTGYCTAYLMTQGAELFWKRGEKEKTDECCRRYLELWDYYRERPEKLFAEQTFVVMTAFYDETKSRMYSYRISLDLERKNTDSLKKYFDDFGWDSRQVPMTEQFMPCLVEAMAELPYEEIFVHVAEVLANKPGMDNFWEEARKINSEDGIRQLIGIFSEIERGIAGEAGIMLKKMLQAEKEDDWDGFSTALKEAVGICPSLGNILKRYAEAYAKQRMERIEEEEMQALAAQIKAQVQILLGQGMRQEALQILEQLRNLTPEDEELEELMRACRK